MSSPPPACRPSARGLAGTGGGALMAVGSMSCVQLRLALSVHLFGQLGPLGVAGLRLARASVLLLVPAPPPPRAFTGQEPAGLALVQVPAPISGGGGWACLLLWLAGGRPG